MIGYLKIKCVPFCCCCCCCCCCSCSVENDEPADDEVEQEDGKDGQGLAVAEVEAVGAEEGRARVYGPRARAHHQRQVHDEERDRLGAALLEQVEQRLVEDGDEHERQQAVAEHAYALKEADLATQQLDVDGDHDGAESDEREDGGELGSARLRVARLQRDGEEHAQAERRPQVPVLEQYVALGRIEDVAELERDGAQVTQYGRRHRLVQRRRRQHGRRRAHVERGRAVALARVRTATATAAANWPTRLCVARLVGRHVAFQVAEIRCVHELHVVVSHCCCCCC